MPITVALDADWVFEQFVHIFCGSVQLEMVWPKVRSTLLKTTCDGYQTVQGCCKLSEVVLCICFGLGLSLL